MGPQKKKKNSRNVTVLFLCGRKCQDNAREQKEENEISWKKINKTTENNNQTRTKKTLYYLTFLSANGVLEEI